MQKIFQNTGKFTVENKHGLNDKGADIILTYNDNSGIPGLDSQHRCLVQIKSYTGEISSLSAIDGLRNAFNEDGDADCGLIITTATKVSDVFLNKLGELRKELNLSIGLLYGEELAKFVMKNL